MELKEKFYLDKKGYEKLLNEIKYLKDELSELRINKADAYENGGDGFHDNFAFEESERRERALMYRLSECLNMLESATLIDKQENANVVDINDIISLTIDFGDEKETDLYKLTSSAENTITNGIINVSLNSPLGKAIYLKQIGESTSYIVNNNKFTVYINEKIDESTLENNNKHLR